ncbi:DNA polymerase III subunit beta [Corynebacterium poyangense]|uniref:Beta sliding clamp n=1 Tax=Corynebacterium poyangense TaxID=2684405 RepID=A0A7H0SKW7_9CORY|nr:DNA polymerase III subunit beta [Corynebacterium poyangense]MBZ8177281.1 DNA polymerase III subunit beta [Corynebacterium poyangense]QNQ89192.1 DNA polymerase III subunit beta [Corynebacterium poyangense]
MESPEVSFRVSKDDLAHAVSWVARSLPNRAAQPVLRAIVINADDNGLEFAGFDYEVSTKVRISAEVLNPGRIAVAGKLIAEITNTLPNKPVDINVEGSKVYVRCGSSRFELPLIPLDDYPQLPKFPDVTGHIDPQLFVRASAQVASAAGRDDTLPMLTGVSMEITGSQLRLVATDRFRLAIRNVEWQPVSQDVAAKLLIPAKTLVENTRSLDSHLTDPVEIAVGTGDNIGKDGLFGIRTQNRETTTRMLDAEFPNIQPLLPKFHNALATVDISRLQEAIRRVSLVTERNSQIRMRFSAEELVLSAGGSDAGHAEETLPCHFEGRDELTIAFNPSYLKDGLSVIDTERVVFGFVESSRPAILVPDLPELPEPSEDGTYVMPETDFLYLLMPVRLPG